MTVCSPWTSAIVDDKDKNVTVTTEDGKTYSYAKDFFHLECVDGRWVIVENLPPPPMGDTKPRE
jgi:hypothetical protein